MRYKLTLKSFDTVITAEFERLWKCPRCEKTLWHSYMALVDVGKPVCEECDVDMELT